MTLLRHAQSQPSLVGEVRRGSALLALVASVPLLFTLVTTAYVLQVLQPRVEQATEVTRELRIAHEGMGDQESALLAWLATGDRGFLRPYGTGTATTGAAHQKLRSDAQVDAPLGRLVAEVLAASASWQGEWAGAAAKADVTGQDRASLARFAAEGKRRFHDYRRAHGSAVQRAAAERDAAVASQRTALTVLLASDLVLAVIALLVVGPRRRRLSRFVDAPLRRLHTAILTVGEGEVLESTRLGVVELDEVSEALCRLSQEVREEQRTARRRTTDALQLAAKLELVLRTSRVMSSCSEVEQVSAAVAAAAEELTGMRARLWTCTDDGELEEVVHPAATTSGPSLDVAAALALAVADRREVHCADGTAWPLVAGGEVLAVLHVARAEGGADEQEHVALEALTLAGAAGMRATRLAETLRQRATTDALTGLRNRYELDRDLTTEWSRSVRHLRPVSFCLLDIDHFKRLNDTDGHQAGDVWLRLVCDTVVQQTRAEDTVYRYGGEEIAVLLRDTDEAEAAAFAERCRKAVEALKGPHGRSVTVSTGVAGRAHGMTGPSDLVETADQALYAAKAGGRNRVVTAAAAWPRHAGIGLPGARPSDDLVGHGGVAMGAVS